jgi:uncharacterized protein DUF3501
MCRAERIIDDAKVQEQIDVYSALLPGPRELSATLFIEIANKDDIKPVLDRFMDIDTGRHVWFEMGRGPVVLGSFEAGHSDEEKGKLTAVHFVRFAFSPEAVEACRSSDADLVVDHLATRARTRLSAETKAELLTDLVS